MLDGLVRSNSSCFKIYFNFLLVNNNLIWIKMLWFFSFYRSSYSRPPDLPENNGNVLKIKEELENGRRLNTAMLNNRVDFVALDNILNGDTLNGNNNLNFFFDFVNLI